MTLKNEKRNMIFAGLVIGVIASLLVLFGNPKNMGFCVACFLRDTAGALPPRGENSFLASAMKKLPKTRPMISGRMYCTASAE